MTPTDTSPDSTIKSVDWRVVAIPTVVLLLAYLPTVIELVSDWWNDDNYSHGFLVPVVSTFLIWSARKELADLPVRSSIWGLAAVVAGMLLFVIGTAAAEYFTARLSLVVTLFGLAWYLLGGKIIRRTWFAFFFLCFMIPVPYVIYYAASFPLQLIATKITVFILNGIGMGVIRQGNIIHIAGGQALEVADACSGIRSLVSLLALGALYAYWSQKRWPAQILLFVSTVPIAVFANVVRVLLTTLMAATVLPEVTEEPLHSIMGMMVFVIAFIGLFITGFVLRRIFR